MDQEGQGTPKINKTDTLGKIHKAKLCGMMCDGCSKYGAGKRYTINMKMRQRREEPDTRDCMGLHSYTMYAQVPLHEIYRSRLTNIRNTNTLPCETDIQNRSNRERNSTKSSWSLPGLISLVQKVDKRRARRTNLELSDSVGDMAHSEQEQLMHSRAETHPATCLADLATADVRRHHVKQPAIIIGQQRLTNISSRVVSSLTKLSKNNTKK